MISIKRFLVIAVMLCSLLLTIAIVYLTTMGVTVFGFMDHCLLLASTTMYFCNLQSKFQNSNSFLQNFCQIPKTYRKYRCRYRADELLLNRFPWRNKATIINFLLHSSDECNFHSSSHDTVRNMEHASMFFKDVPINVLHKIAVDKNISHSENIVHHSPEKKLLKQKPAVEVNHLEFEWHSIFRPLVDVNASGIIFHVTVGYDKPTNSMISFPALMVRIGNYTLEEIVDMTPPPVTEMGLYPRMGITNITNVSIIVYDLTKRFREDIPRDKLISTSTINLPNEMFLPLLQVTIDAGKEGVDQVLIPSIFKEAFFMVIRKHVLGEDKLRASFDKSAEIVGIIKKAFIGKIEESGKAMNDQIDSLTQYLKEQIQSIDDELSLALSDDDNEFLMLVREIKQKWNEIKSEPPKNNKDFIDNITLKKLEKQVLYKFEKCAMDAKENLRSIKANLVHRFLSAMGAVFRLDNNA